MSTQLAKTKEKYGSIKQLLESRSAEIAAALPRHIDPRRMIQVALGALRTNPALLECTQTSLLSAVMSASQLGLELELRGAHDSREQLELKPELRGA